MPLIKICHLGTSPQYQVWSECLNPLLQRVYLECLVSDKHARHASRGKRVQSRLVFLGCLFRDRHVLDVWRTAAFIFDVSSWDMSPCLVRNVSQVYGWAVQWEALNTSQQTFWSVQWEALQTRRRTVIWLDQWEALHTRLIRVNQSFQQFWRAGMTGYGGNGAIKVWRPIKTPTFSTPILWRNSSTSGKYLQKWYKSFTTHRHTHIVIPVQTHKPNNIPTYPQSIF